MRQWVGTRDESYTTLHMQAWHARQVLLSETLAVQFFCELRQGKKAFSRILVFHSLVNLDHTQPVQTVGERRAGVGC